jgi:hypothetical protein
MTSTNGSRTGSAPAGSEAPAAKARPTRADVVRRTLITLVVLGCIGLLVLAAQRADTGEPDTPQATAPEAVEFLTPTRDAEVLQQAGISADLAVGWTGTLVLNGIEIPEDELVLEPGQNIVAFQPGPGRAVEELAPGRNCAQVIVWPANATRARAQTPVEWCFEVT